MIDTKFTEKLRADIKKMHTEMMNKLPPEERVKVQVKLDSMISEEAEKSGNPSLFKDFTKEIYG